MQVDLEHDGLWSRRRAAAVLLLLAAGVLVRCLFPFSHGGGLSRGVEWSGWSGGLSRGVWAALVLRRGLRGWGGVK
jgi:hypothetical protein